MVLRSGRRRAQGINGGDLHLFFTKLNPNDLVTTGSTNSWATWHIADTFALPNGSVTLDLDVVPNGGPPLSLVMFGTMSAKTSGGISLGGMAMGQGGAGFNPGTPVTTLFNGSLTGTTQGVTYILGFEMLVSVGWHVG